MLLKFALIQIWLLFFGCIAEDSSLVVETDTGSVRGVQITTVETKVKFDAFWGIPFAEPPVGENRFKPPVPKGKWSGILDATKESNICVQSVGAGDEDCLYLNVYTPSIKKKNVPVMVVINGGGFINGSALYNDSGPDYFLDKDIIVVSFNYRVGIFGFLSTGDSVVPGNNGLKDQVLVLKWIQRNIAAFGGDPNQVTIMGGSAGAVMVSYMLQSPLTKGLFSKAIIQSGVSISSWGYARWMPDYVKELKKELGIETSNSEKFVECLRSLNVTYLRTVSINQFNKFYQGNSAGRDGVSLGPVIEYDHEDAFLTGKSHQLLVEGKFHHVPTLIGFATFEMNYDLDISYILKLIMLGVYDLFPSKFVPLDMNVADKKIANEIGKRIKEHYFKGKPVVDSMMQYMRSFSDDQFVRPTREFVKIIKETADTYLYRFSYDGEITRSHYKKFTKGASHSEEMFYLWKNAFNITAESDIRMRSQLTTLWTNFVKFGNPTPKVDPLFDNVVWLPTNSLGHGDLICMELDENLTLSVNPEHESMKLWDELYEKYAVPPLDTY